MHYLLSTWTKIKIGKISVRAVAWTACPLLRIEFFPNSYFLVWKLFLGFVFLRFAMLSLSTSSFDIDQQNLMAPFSVGLTRGKKTVWMRVWERFFTISIHRSDICLSLCFAAWGSRGQQKFGSSYCLDGPCAGMNKIHYSFCNYLQWKFSNSLEYNFILSY